MGRDATRAGRDFPGEDDMTTSELWERGSLSGTMLAAAQDAEHAGLADVAKLLRAVAPFIVVGTERRALGRLEGLSAAAEAPGAN
jgi:hypothetical protein